MVGPSPGMTSVDAAERDDAQHSLARPGQCTPQIERRRPRFGLPDHALAMERLEVKKDRGRGKNCVRSVADWLLVAVPLGNGLNRTRVDDHQLAGSDDRQQPQSEMELRADGLICVELGVRLRLWSPPRTRHHPEKLLVCLEAAANE